MHPAEKNGVRSSPGQTWQDECTDDYCPASEPKHPRSSVGICSERNAGLKYWWRRVAFLRQGARDPSSYSATFPHVGSVPSTPPCKFSGGRRQHEDREARIMLRNKRSRPPRPPKPPDRKEPSPGVCPYNKSKWIPGHWKWQRAQMKWVWTRGHWSK